MSNIVVTTSPTVLEEIEIQQAEVIVLHIKNTGAQPLNAFQLRGRGGADPALGMVLLQSSGFTTPGMHCIYANTEPASLAPGAECILYLTPGYLERIDLQASIESGATSLAFSILRSEG